MHYKKTHRVAFAIGILLVLSLVVFGSLIAVASMSMNNAVVVTSDAYSTEETTALAWRLDPSEKRMIDWRLDPNEVRSIDFKIDPKETRIMDYRLDPRIVRVLDYKLDPTQVRIIDFKIDPDQVRIIDHMPDLCGVISARYFGMIEYYTYWW